VQDVGNVNSMNEYETVYDVHSKTYTALFHTGWHLLDMAERHETGSLLNLQAAIVFFAFTFEAYLNHVGEEEIKFWDEIDRISHIKKLNVLEKHLNFDKSKPFFRTVNELFEIRNNFAHGRTVKKTIVKVSETSFPAFDAWNLLPREQLTKETVRRYRDDVKASIESINASRTEPDKLLWNEGSRGATTRSMPIRLKK
jgi:hypothetical protein